MIDEDLVLYFYKSQATHITKHVLSMVFGFHHPYKERPGTNRRAEADRQTRQTDNAMK
jgi:hypothetical protein